MAPKQTKGCAALRAGGTILGPTSTRIGATTSRPTDRLLRTPGPCRLSALAHGAGRTPGRSGLPSRALALPRADSLNRSAAALCVPILEVRLSRIARESLHSAAAIVNGSIKLHCRMGCAAPQWAQHWGGCRKHSRSNITCKVTATSKSGNRGPAVQYFLGSNVSWPDLGNFQVNSKTHTQV